MSDCQGKGEHVAAWSSVWGVTGAATCNLRLKTFLPVTHTRRDIAIIALVLVLLINW